MSASVLAPGLLTTLQDRGRFGLGTLGIGHAGPMDEVSHRLANALVGNADDAVAVELTLLGPTLRFDADATIALAGASFEASLDGQPLPAWCPVFVAAGAVLACGRARHGLRATLAIAGGIRCRRVLGSAATDVNAGLGAPLQAGEALLFTATPPPRARPRWSLDPRPWFDADASAPIRLIPGRHSDALDADSRAALLDAPFRIAADSNRVGYRLDGPHLALAEALDITSEPVATGTVQLPPGGQPIVLMAEHPVTGGYPRIGQVATVDMPRLAQRRPGETVRFAPIDLDDAQMRYLRRERELAQLLDAIRARRA